MKSFTAKAEEPSKHASTNTWPTEKTTRVKNYEFYSGNER